jgi:hypothetical protein
METAPDAARLRALFEQPGLHWILDRLVERMSRGRPLIGTIVNSKSTSEERTSASKPSAVVTSGQSCLKTAVHLRPDNRRSLNG